MHKDLKRILVILVGVLLSTGAYSQVNSVSPYSRLGLGDRVPGELARNYGLAGASQALPQALNIDITNPASYSHIDLTTLEAGLEATWLRQQQQNPQLNISNNRSGFRYLAAGIPLTEKWGSVIGLKPYSFKGYDINSSRQMPSNPEVGINDNFSGEGGLNQVFWGNSYEVYPGLSLGVNFSFLFGVLNDKQRIDFDQQGWLDTQAEEESQLKGVHFEYGLQYIQPLPNDQFLGIGATFVQNDKISAETNQVRYTIEGQRPVDTLAGASSSSGSLQLASELRGGISYGKNHSQTREPAWAVSLDYEIFNGEQFRDAFDRQPYQNGFSLQASGFITPRYSFSGLERNSGYLANVEYRVGGFYEQTPLMVNGQQLNDVGITFGLGLPVKQSQSSPGEVKISTIQIGARLGRRGTLENNLIQEEYLGFYIGVTFNDKWFLDYKYR